MCEIGRMLRPKETEAAAIRHVKSSSAKNDNCALLRTKAHKCNDYKDHSGYSFLVIEVAIDLTRDSSQKIFLFCHCDSVMVSTL